MAKLWDTDQYQKQALVQYNYHISIHFLKYSAYTEQCIGHHLMASRPSGDLSLERHFPGTRATSSGALQELQPTWKRLNALQRFPGKIGTPRTPLVEAACFNHLSENKDLKNFFQKKN